MTESVLWLQEIILNYPTLQYLLIFVGSALGGDFVLIGLAFLCAQGLLSMPALLFFSFTGTFFSDVLLFLLARTQFVHNIISHRYAHKTTSLVVASLQRVGRGNHLLSLTIAKFLVGTRLVIMMYADKTDIHFKKFLQYNACANLIWILSVVPIGLLLGLGYTYFSDVFRNIYAGIGVVALVLVLLVMGEMWLERKFTQPK